jgi:hypothetical protein
MKRTMLVTLDFPPMVGGVANYWGNLNRHFESDNFVVLTQDYDNSLDFDMTQSYLISKKFIFQFKMVLAEMAATFVGNTEAGAAGKNQNVDVHACRSGRHGLLYSEKTDWRALHGFRSRTRYISLRVFETQASDGETDFAQR